MKVQVDLEACESNGICARLCPDVFELGEDDVLRIKVAEVPAEHVERVRLAVAKCPKQALRIEE